MFPVFDDSLGGCVTDLMSGLNEMAMNLTPIHPLFSGSLFIGFEQTMDLIDDFMSDYPAGLVNCSRLWKNL